MAVPIEAKIKPVPKIALIGVERQAAEILRAGFLQFKIESQAIAADPVEALHKKKFEGCVVRLDDKALPVLEAVRGSARNRQITVLGLCDSHEEVSRYSRFGINAVLKLPLDRQETYKTVRAIHLLVLHELRRYVRLPIVLEVEMQTMGGGLITGMTRDISYGGMSVKVPTKISAESALDLKFTLPSGSVVKMPGVVLWFHPPETVGIRFETVDESRQMVRRWIDGFLGIS